MNNEFNRFIVVGALAAVANIAARICLSSWISYLPSIVLAYLIGMISAFLLNRAWVFARSGKPWTHEASWFVVVNLFGLFQTVCVSLILARYVLPALGQVLWIDTTAHVFGVAAPIVTSYFGHKHLSFGKR